MAKQDYIDHVLGSLPSWFVANDRVMENINAFAEIFARAESQSVFYQQMSFIEQATDGPPDWLNQHAVDRATLRQPNETDTALRLRIKSSTDTLTLQAITLATQAIVDAAGIIGTIGVLELRQAKAFCSTNVADTGTGGEFTTSGGDMLFVPTVPFKRFRDVGTTASQKIVTAGASSGNNDGSFDILSVQDDGVIFNNVIGFNEVAPGTSWVIQDVDRQGNVVENYQHAYFSNGFRFGTGGAIIVMLPFGCTSDTQAAVEESLRLVRAPGVKVIVECRTTP